MSKIKTPAIITSSITKLNLYINNVAMYRLVLYALCFYVVVAFVFSFFGMFGLVPFTPLTMLLSLAVILGVSWITNEIFARVYEAPKNVESVYITALILFCIITPPSSGNYTAYFSLAIAASVWAMASKYIFAFGRKHLFNPAAIAVVLTSLTIGQSASWWIGRGDMLAFVILGGLPIVMKIRRFDLVLSFMGAALATIVANTLIQSRDLVYTLSTTFTDTAFLFFALIMLTEPLATPPTTKLRIMYAVLVGFLFAPNLYFGTWHSTPEVALVLGNIFSYIVSPKRKHILRLKERITVARNTYDHVFESDKPISFVAGQYMEWMLPHPNPDSRGNRRYFTIASSPVEQNVRIGARQYSNPSSYKSHLHDLAVGDRIIASQLGGDFVLPKDPHEKLVFIAGGIGITPFRSMIQFLLDQKENRDITILYTNKSKEDAAYTTILEKARVELGITTVYFYADMGALPLEYNERIGMINADAIKKEVPDYQLRMFFVSGPNAMVTGCRSELKSIGVRSRRIKTDYFPGL